MNIDFEHLISAVDDCSYRIEKYTGNKGNRKKLGKEELAQTNADYHASGMQIHNLSRILKTSERKLFTLRKLIIQWETRNQKRFPIEKNQEKLVRFLQEPDTNNGGNALS